MLKKSNFRRTRRIKRGSCPFCDKKTDPDYKNPVGLKEFVSERGKILGRDRTAVCPKHQRLLGKAIKRARQLALLPFINKI